MVAVLALVAFASVVYGRSTTPPVYVTLWFDTEDYILPQDDDAAKRVAETLTSAGVRATFKIVGEKARVLEQRGRTDVIAALKKHEIGYHSNTHSGQPTIAVYLQHALGRRRRRVLPPRGAGRPRRDAHLRDNTDLLRPARRRLGAAVLRGAGEVGHRDVPGRGRSCRD
jgi:hypothetical protein